LLIVIDPINEFFELLLQLVICLIAVQTAVFGLLFGLLDGSVYEKILKSNKTTEKFLRLIDEFRNDTVITIYLGILSIVGFFACKNKEMLVYYSSNNIYLVYYLIKTITLISFALIISTLIEEVEVAYSLFKAKALLDSKITKK